MNRIDPATYATTGREYTAIDADGNEHVIVKSAELAGTNWNTYFVHATGRVEISGREMRTLAAARAHVAQVGGYTA
jgi:hypothetical protein